MKANQHMQSDMAVNGHTLKANNSQKIRVRPITAVKRTEPKTTSIQTTFKDDIYEESSNKMTS